jgi:hypothetical protein
LFLGLGGAETRFGLLAGPFELPQARRAGGPLSVGLRLVQLVTLAGVLSLCSQIVKVFDGHRLELNAGGSPICR